MKKIIGYILTLTMLLQFAVLPVHASEDSSQDISYDETIAQYAEFDYSDPNIITDEELFGKWENEEWVEGPLFDYENYPGLSVVEELAKIGNYEEAKVALLDYYRNGPFRNYKYDNSSVDGSAINNRMFAEALMENLQVFGNDVEAVEKLTLTETDEWLCADAQFSLNKMVSGGYSSITFLLVDLKKDGYSAAFNSHENSEEGTGAYLEVVVNDAKRRYPVIHDAYVRGGDYLNENFGSEEVLLCEESITSINASSPIDEYSRRSYLNFVLNDINPEDRVSDAKLYIYGRMIESDAPGGIPKEKESIDVLIFDDPMRTFSEQSLKWNNVTMDYAFSFDGEPGPQTITSPPTPNAYKWSDAVDGTAYTRTVAVYRATKDERYAYHALRNIVNGIRVRGTNYRESLQPLFMAGLRLHHLFHDMPTLIYSESMSPEWFTIILKWFHYHMDYLVNCWDIEGEGSNIGQLLTRDLLMPAYMFTEFKRFSEPLGPVRDPQYPGSVTGGWAAVGAWRSIYKLKDTINPDGSGTDIPTGYVATNLSGFFVPYDKIGRILNKKVDTALDEDGVQLMRNVAKYAIDTSNPVFGAWQHGDDNAWNGPAVNHIMGYCKPFIEDDDFIDWYLSGGVEGKAPDYTSVFYESNARAVLRNSWDKNAVSMEINADSAYKSHGHFDDLAANVFAYGKYLLADKNSTDYTQNPGAYNWIKSTRAHNTIEINDTSQKAYISSNMGLENYYDEPLHGSINKSTGPGTLHPENRETNGVYDFVRAETEGYIDNGALESDYRVYRDVLFIKPGYFIVTDVIDPEDDEKVNKYSQAWHYMPESNVEVNQETLVSKTHFATGANIAVAPIDDRGELTATKRDGLYAKSTGVLSPEKTHYTQILKNVAGDTSFMTILYPEKPGEDVDVFTHRETLDVANNVADAFSASIINTKTNATTNLSYYTLHDETQKAPRVFGNYETDGVLAFVESEGNNLSTIILRKGSFVDDNTGIKLFSSTEEFEDIGISFEGTTVNIEASKDVDIEKFSSAQIGIKAKKANTVLLNGEAVGYVYQNGYICMNGFIPPEESESEDDETDGSENSGSHGSGGGIFTGGGSGGGGGSSEKENKPEQEDPKPETPEVDVTTKYTDVETHWAKNEIISLSEEGIISGYEDGTFKPDNNITRAEFLTLATRMMDSDDKVNISFDDVSSDDWYYDVVRKGVALGIISEDTSFRPNDLISREEMCKIISIICDKKGLFDGGTKIINFEDKEDISPWATPYVAKMTTNGIIKGNDRGEFLPKGKTTRAEAAAVISRILNATAE